MACHANVDNCLSRYGEARWVGVWEVHAGLHLCIAAVDCVSGVVGYLGMAVVLIVFVAGGIDEGWRGGGCAVVAVAGSWIGW